MDKKTLTEADIRTKFITPALVGADGGKWDLLAQVREEVFLTKGRVIVRGKTVQRGEAKKADYVLSYKPNLPLAVIEAKDNTHEVGFLRRRFGQGSAVLPASVVIGPLEISLISPQAPR